MSVHLYSTFGPPVDVRLTADDLPAMIGRSDEAEIFVGDQWVSRRHAELIVVGERVKVIDLGSRHGTYVNDQCVEEEWLEPGDELSVGMTTLKFEGSLVPDVPSSGCLQLAAI
jgi:pSer/pThr/pTyr-binding forkhead associated (FHA) protein